MRRAPPRDNCILTTYGCTRLSWNFENDTDECPALEVVDVSVLLRVEQVHSDIRDIAERHGLESMPSSARSTPEERREARIFMNVFYRWTARRQSPSKCVCVCLLMSYGFMFSVELYTMTFYLSALFWSS